MIAVAERTALEALEALAEDTGIVSGLRLAEQLAWAAARVDVPMPLVDRLAAAVTQTDDELLAIAAVHALSATPGDEVAPLLTDHLGDARHHVAEHAAWALSARPPYGPALPDLVRLVAGSGFTGMIAQRTLRGWAPSIPFAVSSAVTAGVLVGDGDQVRLVETLGLVPTSTNEQFLCVIAADSAAQVGVRRAAVAALGDLQPSADVSALLHRLATSDDDVAADALLALLDGTDLTNRREHSGLRIAQVFLYADLALGNAGVGGGDSGGIGTLLSLLSSALAARHDVAEVRSLSRGSVDDALAAAWTVGTSETERFEPIPFADGERIDAATAWPYRIEIERGILRALRRGGLPHVLHVRLADAGTLAAQSAARRLGVPLVFTAAPDPHAVLDELDGRTALTRADIGAGDVRNHWWYRARMVEQLTRQADAVALLPRNGLTNELHRLLDFNVDEQRHRSAVIPEGIHAATVRAASAEVVGTAAAPWPPGVDALVAAIKQLPADRHGLPLIVSVGRLHPAKGMDRIVQAWVSSPLMSRANLVVVGGNLDNPSADELDVLATIDDVVEADGAAHGLVLLGRLPHGAVAGILVAAALGAPPLVAAGGVYVCGSVKEEFGLAIVEALASGMPVVAPRRGGPATYVADGVSGVLVDTSSVAAIADGIVAAFALAADRHAVQRAAADILDRLTIEAMAEKLVALYETVAATPHGRRP